MKSYGRRGATPTAKEFHIIDLSALDAWPHLWSIKALSTPPLIAPARQYTYPAPVPGEEDALARGALYLLARAERNSPEYLAICARGFGSPAMPTGVFATPHPGRLLAVAGGYGYLLEPGDPRLSTQIPLRPITAVRPLPEHDLLLCCGFHAVTAWGRDGLVWTSARLSWEGVQLGEVEAGHLAGLGWDMMADREVPFSIDLTTGRHTGGGFRPRP